MTSRTRPKLRAPALLRQTPRIARQAEQTAMNASAYKQIDVFTSRRFFGNALAVVIDADGLAPEDMQRIAAWINLSETAFALPPTRPGASYRVRIFTPRSELGFAGHPSVGTAHALLDAGLIDAKDTLLQECAAGLLPVRVLGEGADRRIFVRVPRAEVAAIDAPALDATVRALAGAPLDGTPPRIVDLGLKWLICDLGGESAVRTLQPDMAAVAAVSQRLGAVGVSVFGRTVGQACAVAVRAFCPGDGIPEDPVTGSANAAIGAYLLASGGLAAIGNNYCASQGREVGRDGVVEVRVDPATGDVEIGGQSVTCADGTLVLPRRGET
jgi:PhzF family phenazine biosynthesis protein